VTSFLFGLSGARQPFSVRLLIMAHAPYIAGA
jgi:hypothetical protein